MTLAHVFLSYGADFSFRTKVMTVFGCAIGFIIPALATNYLFSQKSKVLFFIDAGVLAFVLYNHGRGSRSYQLVEYESNTKCA